MTISAELSRQKETLINEAINSRLTGNFDEPGWLWSLRKLAQEQLSKLSLPDTNTELWRKTSPEVFCPPVDPVHPEIHLATVDTTVVSEVNPEAVKILDLQQAWDKSESALSSLLFSCLKPHTDFFSAASAVLTKAGTFIDVTSGHDISSDPVVIQHKSTSGLALPHNVIHVGKNAKAVVIDEFQGEGPDYAWPVIEIFLEENSFLQYIFLNAWPEHTAALTRIQADIARDARLQTLFVGTGTKLSKLISTSNLKGEGAVSESLGVILAGKKQHYDLHVSQHHINGNTTSNVIFHVALAGKARTVFSGNIEVDQQAQKIDGYQTNRNLLLSPLARAESIPKLEILADDVKCSHGATFSSYDKEQEFYLQSRGLTRTEAQKMLITGFFQAIIDRLEQEQSIAKLDEHLQAALTTFLKEI